MPHHLGIRTLWLGIAVSVGGAGGPLFAAGDRCCQQPDTVVAKDLERPKGPVLLFDMRGGSKSMRFVDSVNDTTWTALTEFLGTPIDEKLKDVTPHFTAVGADADRVFWSSGTRVVLLLLHADPCSPIIKVSEKRRDTQLAKDLAVLLKTVLGKLGGAEAAIPQIKVSISTVVLHETRANLTVAARSVPKKTDSCEITAEACKDGSCVYQATEFVTGPTEHVFLSVDVPLSKVSALKYDSDTRTLVPKDAPTKVYVGVNWMFGDVVEPTPGSWGRPLERLLIKGMIEASAKPSNSFGLALGYRPPPVDVGGFGLDALQVWGGYVWLREDAVSSEGKPRADAKYQGSFRWGVSFNIAKLKDWLTLK